MNPWMLWPTELLKMLLAPAIDRPAHANSMHQRNFEDHSPQAFTFKENAKQQILYPALSTTANKVSMLQEHFLRRVFASFVVPKPFAGDFHRFPIERRMSRLRCLKEGAGNAAVVLGALLVFLGHL